MTGTDGRVAGSDPFDLTGRVAVVCGGYGVLGGAIAAELGRAGARVAVLGRCRERAEAQAGAIGGAIALPADVLDEEALARARGELQDRWGAADILVNAAGGERAPCPQRTAGASSTCPRTPSTRHSA